MKKYLHYTLGLLLFFSNLQSCISHSPTSLNPSTRILRSRSHSYSSSSSSSGSGSLGATEGIIVGSIVGGIFLLAGLVILIICCIRRMKRSRQEKKLENELALQTPKIEIAEPEMIIAEPSEKGGLEYHSEEMVGWSKKYTLVEIDENGRFEGQENCGICKEPFWVNGTVALGCGHAFHVGCLKDEEICAVCQGGEERVG